FDSHFSLSGFGPAARNRSLAASLGDNSTMTTSFYGDYGAPGTAAANWDELESTAQNGFGPFVGAGASFIVGPGSHVGDPAGTGANPENQARAGIAVAPPPVSSHFAPNVTGGRSAFDGVFVARFTVHSGATLSGGMFFNTLVAPGQSFGANLVLGGPAVLFSTHNGPQLFALRAYKVGSTFIDNPSDATSAGLNDGIEFGQADVWDLWVQVVPAPGSVALMGLAGLAGIRRRRA
ncbi:MAG: PEP-CTERM sorting domain-containing protein, partial [Phycisphaerae bacterium]|nr:PEP-CTERM sorting domain-containing protein [Phycisphaerae bacterium]